MRNLKFFSQWALTTTCVIALNACTINPTPVGYASKPEKGGKNGFVADFTTRIVSHVDCETRDAFMGIAAALLERQYDNYPGTGEIVRALRTDPAKVRQSKPWDIDPVAHVRLGFFLQSKITMSYELIVTENTNHALTIAISPTNSSDAFSLKFGDSKVNLARKNTKTFDVDARAISKFQGMACDYDENEVKRKRNRHKDWFYPLRGNINLAKTIRTFIDYTLLRITPQKRHALAEKALAVAFTRAYSVKTPMLSSDEIVRTNKEFRKFANANRGCDSNNDEACSRNLACYRKILTSAGEEYANLLYNEINDTTPEMADALKFTTVLGTSTNPSIAFGVAGESFKVQDLGYKFAPDRTDEHTLTVSLKGRDKPVKKTSDPTELTIGGNSKAKIVLQIPQGPADSTIIEECGPKMATGTNKMRKGGRKGRKFAPDTAAADQETGLFVAPEISKDELDRATKSHKDTVIFNLRSELTREIEKLQ